MTAYKSTEITAEIKNATQSSHARVEAKLGKFLFSPLLTLNEYNIIISTFHEIHSGLEPVLKKYLSSTQLMENRSKLVLLEKDLLNLGSESPFKLPSKLYRFEPKIDNPASALGALYVIEGSTLGGNIIAKRLLSHSWMDQAYLNYFTSYGSSRAKMWQSFLLTLNDHDLVKPHSRQLTINGALHAFDIFEKAFEALENHLQNNLQNHTSHEDFAIGACGA